jgi:uncharacterized SAM-binding protein YcdF (DUF218 family)
VGELFEPTMKLAKADIDGLARRFTPQDIALDAALGVTAGFLSWELGGGYVMNRGIISFVTATIFGAVLVGFLGRRAWLIWLDMLLLVVYFVAALSPLTVWLSRSWVRHDPLPPNAQAVVVLSGTVRSDSALSTDALDRLLSGIEIVKADTSLRLVTTRVFEDFDFGRVVSDVDQRRLIGLVGLMKNWTLVDSVGTTRDEAVRVAALLLPVGQRNIILVTAPMHTRRSCSSFEAVGFVVACRASREHEHVTVNPRWPRDRLETFRDYVYERLGMVKYRYKGWLRPA